MAKKEIPMEIKRPVRLDGKTYREGDEEALNAVLPATSIGRLVEKEYITGDGWSGVTEDGKAGKAQTAPNWQRSDDGPGGSELPNDFPGVNKLTAAGYLTLEDVKGMSEEDINGIQGLKAETREKLRAAVAELNK